MPYSKQHKAEVRKHIIEHARVLFNRKGFNAVTIDEIMAEAGLTRGGFYNHFANKEELYTAAVESFLNGRGKAWRESAGVIPVGGGPQTVRNMIDSYLSSEHLGDLDGQCPMIALPSDVARSNSETRAAYEKLLNAMVWLFENNLADDQSDAGQTALALSALCVGGMVLSRTLEDDAAANAVRNATRDMALRISGLGQTRNTDKIVLPD